MTDEKDNINQQDDVNAEPLPEEVLQELNDQFVETFKTFINVALSVSTEEASMKTGITHEFWQKLFYSDTYKELQKAVKTIKKTLPFWLADSSALAPYLEEELKKPEYAGKTKEELSNEARAGDSSLFEKAIMAAGEAFADAMENADRITIKRAESVEYPLDKPNSIIWNLLEKDTRGQVTFNLAKYGSKQQLPAFYSINFDDLGTDVKITKRLLPTDKLIYIAVSALFNAGNTTITLSQIHYAMGNTGRPSAKQLEKINNAITKMTGARIYFDNQKESEQYKDYPRFKYDGSLLPLERGTVTVNGKLTDAAIHIFREPPLITFAKQRKQITTLDIKLLQAPVSKTDTNLLIQDYLLERICKAKNQNRKSKNCRILNKTLFAHIGMPDKPKTNAEKMAKQRAPGKVKEYLDYYKTCNFISRYTIEQDGITIYWK